MLSTRFLFPAISGIAFFALGVVMRNWNLMIMAIPLCISAAIIPFLGNVEPELHVERTVSRDRIIEGGHVNIKVKIFNKGGTLEHIKIEDPLPERAEVTSGVGGWFGRLKSGDTAQFEYTLFFGEPGKYTLLPLRMDISSLLSYKRNSVQYELPSTVTVLPAISDSRRGRLVPTKVRQRLGSIVARRSGLGSEFYSIREYQMGDDLRRVNWRATARTGQIHVNETHGERSGDAVIVVDARKVSDMGQGKHSMVNWCIRGAATAASMVLKERNRVGLLIQKDVMDWVYPGYGKRQLHKILEALVSTREGGQWGFDQITWVVSRFFPTQSQIIIISPLADPSSIEGIVSLRNHGYDVLVISPSPISSPDIQDLSGIEGNMICKIIEMERRADIEWLSNYVRVLDWDTSKPLEAYLRKGRGTAR